MNVRSTLEKLVKLIDADRLDEAEELCRQALKINVDDARLLAVLGEVLLTRGELDDAERALVRATRLEPSFPKPWEHLGALCLARKQPDRAEKYHSIAAAMRLAGKAPAQRILQADELRKSGDVAAAEQICRDVLRRTPEDPHALRTLAMIATDAEQYVVAENQLRQIVGLLVGSARAVIDLARFLGDRGRYHEAVAALENVEGAAAEDFELQRTLGDMLAIVGRSNDALSAYERSLSSRPDDTRALMGRGHMLRILGDATTAAECYRRCISTQATSGDAWWSLASLRNVQFDADDRRAIESALDNVETPKQARVGLHFALARAHESSANYDLAWRQYLLGNGLQRELIKYDPVDTELTLRGIQSVFTRDILAAEPASTPASPVPIFILGMPRSGSTLIEQILASHSKVVGCGELPYVIMLANSLRSGGGDVRYPDVVREHDAMARTGLGRSYLHHASRHLEPGAAYFTDKMPANFSHAGFIRLMLPNARIIDARRDPMACCVANFRQLYAQGKHQTYDLGEFAEYYLMYVGMMRHWDEVMPGAILRVQYEDLVLDTEQQVRRMLDFCGLPFEEACLEFHRNKRPVNTASAEQVREQIYDSSVAFWRNYEPWLDELKAVLDSVR